MYKKNMKGRICSAHSPTTQQRNKFFAMPRNGSEWTNPKYFFGSQSGQYLLSSVLLSQLIQFNATQGLKELIVLTHLFGPYLKHPI